MDEKNLYEVKEYLQNLLDKYLPEEDRFSIIDFDEELIFILIDLLSEKDESKKINTYQKLYDKMMLLDRKIEGDYNSIKKLTNKIFLSEIEEQERVELENFEKDFDEKLNDL